MARVSLRRAVGSSFGWSCRPWMRSAGRRSPKCARAAERAPPKSTAPCASTVAASTSPRCRLPCKHRPPGSAQPPPRASTLPLPMRPQDGRRRARRPCRPRRPRCPRRHCRQRRRTRCPQHHLRPFRHMRRYQPPPLPPASYRRGGKGQVQAHPRRLQPYHHDRQHHNRQRHDRGCSAGVRSAQPSSQAA